MTEPKTVRIEYWVQDTIESGHHEWTAPMTREEANRLMDLRIFVSARILKTED